MTTFSRSLLLCQMFLSVALSNMNPIFAKVLYRNGWSPIALYFSVLVVVVCVLTVHEIVALQRGERWGMTRADVLGTVITAVCGGFIAPVLFYEGLQRVSASESIIISGVLPFFVVCFAVLFLGERFKKREIAGGVCILAGFAVLRWSDIREFHMDAGTWMLLISSALSAFTVIMHKKLVQHRHIDAVIIVRSALSLLLVAGWMALRSPGDFAQLQAPQNVWLFLALPMVSYLLPFFLYFTALRKLTAGDAGLAEAVGRVIGLLVAGIVLGEAFTTQRIASLVCILLGIILVSVPLTRLRIAPSRLPVLGPLRQ